MTPEEIEAKLWAGVKVGGPDECWEWQGCTQHNGYGQIRIGRSQPRAHRVAYEVSVGPIPEGLIVMHSCDNPPCCNPTHLRVGTQAENMADRDAKGRNFFAAKTHCKHGHEFTEANTYINGAGHRLCRACGAARKRAQRQLLTEGGTGDLR